MENNNIIHHPFGTVIINGGNALPGCPNDWDEAKVLTEKLNHGEEEPWLKWSFDCGFKLDYDGPLLRISSRFYPPKTSYGPTWDGWVRIKLLDEEVAAKEFDCPTLDELHEQVEEYVNSFIDKLKLFFKTLPQ
jgi:hypothetical protein